MKSLITRAFCGRHRLTALLTTIVVALVVGAVIAPLTAANRSEESFRLLRAATMASDVVIGAEDLDAAGARAARAIEIDSVVAVSVEGSPFIRPAGTELFPDFNLVARAPQAETEMNSPVIVAGRAVDPDAVDELVINERLATELDVEVGDLVALESMTWEWIDITYNGGDAGPLDGPRFDAEVVGIARSPADFTRASRVMHLSPAFLARYGSEMAMYSQVHLRLDDPTVVADDNSELRRQLIEAFGDDEIQLSYFADNGSTDDSLSTIATTLRIVAGVAGIAGAMVLVLTFARVTREALADRAALVAMGASSRQLFAGALSAGAPFLVIGVVVGSIVGALAAPAAMVGLASRADPGTSGWLVDPTMIAAVGLAVAATSVVVVGWVAIRGGRTADRRTRSVASVPRIDHPLPVTVGVRHALAGEPARGGRASRATVAVMTIGLAGAVAALAVSASIDHLRDHPFLFGQTEARVVQSGESIDVFSRALPVLDSDDRVESLAAIHIFFGVALDGGGEFTLLAHDFMRGDLTLSLIDGRMAIQSDEVALGPETLQRLGRRIGDTVLISSDVGSEEFRVVGEVLFPEGDFTHDDGLALTTDGAAKVAGSIDDAALHQLTFEWAPGVDVETASADLAAAGFQSELPNETLEPAKVANLGDVVALPRYLAGFLVLLAVVTLGFAVAVNARRRRREHATLRALGMTPGRVSAIVGVQAATILSISLVVGVPLGAVLGGRVWASIASRTSVLAVTVVPAAGVAVVVAIACVATFVSAVVPIVTTRRLRVADVIHIE